MQSTCPFLVRTTQYHCYVSSNLLCQHFRELLQYLVSSTILEKKVKSDSSWVWVQPIIFYNKDTITNKKRRSWHCPFTIKAETGWLEEMNGNILPVHLPTLVYSMWLPAYTASILSDMFKHNQSCILQQWICFIAIIMHDIVHNIVYNTVYDIMSM